MNPHSLILPSSAELVQAFLKDLGNVLELSTGQTAETTTLLLFISSGATTTWKASQDYVLTAVMPVAGTNTSALTTDGSTYNQNFAAAGNKKLGPVLYLGGISSQQTPFYQRTRINSGDTITFNNASASNGCFLLILEIA